MDTRELIIDEQGEVLQPSFHDLTLVSITLKDRVSILEFNGRETGNLKIDNTCSIWSAGVVMPLIVSGIYYLAEADFLSRIDNFLAGSEEPAFQEQRKIFPEATHILILVQIFGSPLLLLVGSST